MSAINYQIASTYTCWCNARNRHIHLDFRHVEMDSPYGYSIKRFEIGNLFSSFVYSVSISIMSVW